MDRQRQKAMYARMHRQLWPSRESHATWTRSKFEELQPVKADMGGGIYDFKADKPDTSIFRGPFKEPEARK